jgi:hypothetical protein
VLAGEGVLADDAGGAGDGVVAPVVPAADPPHDARTISSPTLPHWTFTAARIGGSQGQGNRSAVMFFGDGADIYVTSAPKNAGEAVRRGRGRNARRLKGPRLRH